MKEITFYHFNGKKALNLLLFYFLFDVNPDELSKRLKKPEIITDCDFVIFAMQFDKPENSVTGVEPFYKNWYLTAQGDYLNDNDRHRLTGFCRELDKNKGNVEGESGR